MLIPTLVEVTRGDYVESRHRGSVAVVDVYGSLILSLGAVADPIYPRSAVKPIQALPLVESGAADEFALSTEALALACASHSGEPQHVEMVARTLARLDLDLTSLECGAHWPLDELSTRALVREASQPTALHNNCSGKHAGFLCVARAMGLNCRGYIDTAHPVQQQVKSAIEYMTGIKLEISAIDGCSIPTFMMPLKSLAYAFARLGTGFKLPPERAKAVNRLLTACFDHPWYFGGTNRFCTEIIGKLAPRVFVKMGAEGIFAATFPELGLGVAVKCEDGGLRAAEVIMAALIARFLPLQESELDSIERFIRPQIFTWNKRSTGVVRPASVLFAN